MSCNTNYYYAALFFGRENYGSYFNAFLECKKMTLIVCDTKWPYFFGGPEARAFLAL